MKNNYKPPKRWLGGKTGLIIYAVSAFIIISVGILLLCYFLELEAIRKNVDFDNPVTAKIYKLVPVNSSDNTLYDLKYRYISPDGIEYSGYYKFNVNYEDAMSAYNSEITIYIGAEGFSTAWIEDRFPNKTPLYAALPLLIGGVLFAFIFLIPYKWPERKPETEMERKIREIRSQEDYNAD